MATQSGLLVGDPHVFSAVIAPARRSCHTARNRIRVAYACRQQELADADREQGAEQDLADDAQQDSEQDPTDDEDFASDDGFSDDS